jgi:NAD(P) transhydrogenase
MGDIEGMLKLIFHRETLQLLGVHIIGERATELIHVGQAVIAYGGTIEYFIDNVVNYPTLSEAYKIAALNGYNRL